MLGIIMVLGGVGAALAATLIYTIVGHYIGEINIEDLKAIGPMRVYGADDPRIWDPRYVATGDMVGKVIFVGGIVALIGVLFLPGV